MKRKASTRVGLLGLGSILVLALAGPAHAVDGVIEINQARAKAGGVTATDTPGFPVTIDKAGSYRLTSNLDLTGEPTPENLQAIEITADNVTVDLNGFSIIGTTVCSGSPTVTSCTPTGTGDGIFSNNGDITVRNGTVTGMGDDGIWILGPATVEGVQAISNGDSGIDLGGPSKVTGSTSRANGNHGILAYGGSLIAGNASRRNKGFGLILPSVGANKPGYSENVFSLNGSGSVTGGVQIGPNLCDGAVCP